MTRTLIVSGTEKGIATLSTLLQGVSPCHVIPSTSGAQTRRMLSQEDYDCIVINSPLPDESGEELAILAASATFASVILLARGPFVQAITPKMEQAGVLVVAKPVNPALFAQTCRLASASRKRMLGLQSENVRLQQKIEEIRLVDRAKCVLIQYLNMSEPQAHRYIEKQAMDLRLSKLEVAENILKTYET